MKVKAAYFSSWLKVVFPPFILLITFNNTSSQNYTCVNEGRILAYSSPKYGNSEDIKFLKTDTSFIYGLDTLLIFEDHFRQVDST